jgi:hypothetical protein
MNSSSKALLFKRRILMAEYNQVYNNIFLAVRDGFVTAVKKDHVEFSYKHGQTNQELLKDKKAVEALGYKCETENNVLKVFCSMK